MRRRAWVLMHDRHAAEGDTLGSHEKVMPIGRTTSTRHLETSKALVKILRHQIGAKRGNSIPCNGGGWVNIGHILDCEDVFPQYRYRKGDRFQIIAECIRSEDRKARKPRLQTSPANNGKRLPRHAMAFPCFPLLSLAFLRLTLLFPLRCLAFPCFPFPLRSHFLAAPCFPLFSLAFPCCPLLCPCFCLLCLAAPCFTLFSLASLALLSLAFPCFPLFSLVFPCCPLLSFALPFCARAFA